MSWSTRLGGRRRRSSYSSDPSNLRDVLESGDASIEAFEIGVKEQERVLAGAEIGLAEVEATVKKYGAEHLDPDQAEEIEAMRANIKMMRANLKLDKIEVKQAR